jgi:hypothetical protein
MDVQAAIPISASYIAIKYSFVILANKLTLQNCDTLFAMFMVLFLIRNPTPLL